MNSSKDIACAGTAPKNARLKIPPRRPRASLRLLASALMINGEDFALRSCMVGLRKGEEMGAVMNADAQATKE
eukprot:CAMPEP_0202833750 /NCGR_PEP_ID=MMETSP1389-20130828/28135_1 /ASSEMBLY_ACC=CAM_ASM_000865 /TAXON_ID=302021 /ORGANISM="Rhodomonas sp., Strain CCMP768" /LENGTH=72 /DNA_ID=CAMNT_0049508603 /DNA_START=42 /DNA_END=257 /DNA_ORIENTATION=-